jgi:predicted dehydrogenase
MRQRPKIGLIGCGQVSRVGHGPAICHLKRAEITAIADPDDANRKHFKRKFRVRRDYRDHKEMLEREDLDAVVIATPPWLHAAQVSDCVAANVHILCEKPLATTLEDCRKIVELCRSYGKHVQIGHSKRFETGFQQIKKWLDTGSLGRVYQMSIAWHYFIPDFSTGWLHACLHGLKTVGIDLEKKYGTWRYFDERAGGGDFFDHGPHYIDLLRFFFGEIESIYCKTGRFHRSRKFEDLAIAVFVLENGTFAVFEKSTMVMGRPSGFETGHLYAEKAKVAFEAFQEYKLQPMRLGIYRLSNLLTDTYSPVKLPAGKENTLYFRQMRHFIDRISGRDGAAAPGDQERAASPYDAMLAVAWTLGGYRSAEEGREIRKQELLEGLRER